ncbi:hypothetical protein ACIMNZ_06345 [Escherichia coli]
MKIQPFGARCSEFVATNIRAKLHLPGEKSAKYLKIIAFFSGFDLLIFTFQHHFINIPLVFFFIVMIIAITAIYFSLHRLTQKNV